MSFRNLMTIGAVLAGGFGVAFIVAADLMLSLYGLAVGPTSIFVARMLGAEFSGFGLLAWLVRDADRPQVRHPVLVSFLVADLCGFLVALLAQVSGTMNWVGWSIPAIFLLMTVAWAHLLLKESRTGGK